MIANRYTNRHVYLPAAMKRSLNYLSNVSGRPPQWILEQAIQALLRDLQDGVVTVADIEKPHRKGGMVHMDTTPPPWLIYRLDDLWAKWGIPPTATTRWAFSRYLSKRQLLLSGKKEYTDDLIEKPPV